MHVTVIAKTPVAGRVKTRLCPPCSADQAAQIARAALSETLYAAHDAAAKCDALPVLLLDGQVQAWMPPAFEVVNQRGDGLEERLCNGFRDLGPGVIVGMETPHVVPFVADAVRWARRGVDTIGLATDGGYWMIGLCTETIGIVDELFRELPMSRSHTGLAQLRRLHAHGRSVRLLPMARDLDTIADLRAVADSGRSGELVAAAVAVLASLR